MENISQFDLNVALRQWLDRLAQSPQVKTENLRELESHVRDSMSQLEGKGLSSEESFLVATHRVGSAEKLEPEFAKVNRNPWNLILHGLVLLFFSVCCWLLWGILHFPELMVPAMPDRPFPAFTRFMMGCSSFLAIPPALALGYCVYVWVQKSIMKSSWIGFFATTTAVLILVTLFVSAAVLLPVIQFMVQHGSK